MLRQVPGASETKCTEIQINLLSFSSARKQYLNRAQAFTQNKVSYGHLSRRWVLYWWRWIGQYWCCRLGSRWRGQQSQSAGLWSRTWPRALVIVSLSLRLHLVLFCSKHKYENFENDIAFCAVLWQKYLNVSVFGTLAQTSLV